MDGQFLIKYLASFHRSLKQIPLETLTDLTKILAEKLQEGEDIQNSHRLIKEVGAVVNLSEGRHPSINQQFTIILENATNGRFILSNFVGLLDYLCVFKNFSVEDKAKAV